MDLAILQARLTDAQLAYHALMIGKATASVSYDGKSVTYTQATMGNLAAYVALLQNQIAALTGLRIRRGPILASF